MEEKDSAAKNKANVADEESDGKVEKVWNDSAV